MEWNEETISHLRTLWQEGLSTAEIGRRLSTTKNAIVGKAHRLVLPARPSPIRKPSEAAGGSQPRSRRRKALRPAEVAAIQDIAPQNIPRMAERPSATVTPLRVVQPRPAPEQPVAAPSARETTPSRRRGQNCCWPLGEPGTKQFRFCGAEPLHGKPYCEQHAQLAYVKLRDRRDTVA